MMGRIAIVTAMLGLLSWGRSTGGEPVLDAVTMTVVSVADSQGYFVYSYELANSERSTWALSRVQVEVTGVAGAFVRRPATGQFFDLSYQSAARTDVGPIAPSSWFSLLTRDGELSWGAVASRFLSEDSIGPGQTKGGFGLRSALLPGLSDFEAFPTVEACCRLPFDSLDGEPMYRRPESFAVPGATIAPVHRPEEMTFALLSTQVSTMCADRLWIHTDALCDSFEHLLSQDQRGFERADVRRTAALDSIMRVVESTPALGGAMSSNAYWLLRMNVAQLLRSQAGR